MSVIQITDGCDGREDGGKADKAVENLFDIFKTKLSDAIDLEGHFVAGADRNRIVIHNDVRLSGLRECQNPHTCCSRSCGIGREALVEMLG